MNSLTRNQFLVLASLLSCPLHPYAIRQEIIELTGHEVWPSQTSVKRAIEKLLKAKLIQEEFDSRPSYWLKARRSSPYEMTDQGYWAVRRELAMYHLIFSKSWPRLEQNNDNRP